MPDDPPPADDPSLDDQPEEKSNGKTIALAVSLLMVLLGGVQTVAGPVVGALAYTGLYDALLRATDLWRLVLGASIILLVLAFPEGIAGAAQRLWLRVRLV